MKKLLILLTLVFVISFSSFSQYGYTIDFFGEMNYRELINPSNSTLIGTSLTQVGASDFSNDGDLYAISGIDNGLYLIDTSTGSAVLLGIVTPPGSEFWTGMAFDPTDGTMYICSTDGNSSSYYALDPGNTTLTLIGTHTIEDGVVGIAFDDSGQMYAIYLVRKFYMVDKTDATATYVGDLFEAVTGFPHHGLDFDPITQTMFMVSYNAFSFDNQLWTIDLSTGSNTLLGSVGLWTGSVTVEPSETLTAGFSADTTEICQGDTISFTDESTGDPISWLWTFEGGTPSTTSQQNPEIIYETTGEFDVTLEVSDGTNSNSLLVENFIMVNETPTPQVSGMVEPCQGDFEMYSTPNIPGNTYNWIVDGGILINGNGTNEITVEWDEVTVAHITLTESNNNCSTTTEPLEVNVVLCFDVDEHKDQPVHIYPNPVKDFLRIEMDHPDEISVEVINHIGKYVLDKKFTHPINRKVEIYAGNLQNGVYIVIVKDRKGSAYFCKFVKSD